MAPHSEQHQTARGCSVAIRDIRPLAYAGLRVVQAFSAAHTSYSIHVAPSTALRNRTRASYEPAQQIFGALAPLDPRVGTRHRNRARPRRELDDHRRDSRQIDV